MFFIQSSWANPASTPAKYLLHLAPVTTGETDVSPATRPEFRTKALIKTRPKKGGGFRTLHLITIIIPSPVEHVFLSRPRLRTLHREGIVVVRVYEEILNSVSRFFPNSDESINLFRFISTVWQIE